jgi:Ca-activated chloride channel family protein
MKKLMFIITLIGVIVLSGCAMSDSDSIENLSDGVYNIKLTGEAENPIDYGEYAVTYDGVDILQENIVTNTADLNTSTFSIDVDTAGYSTFRRYVSENMMPPVNQIRTEEMVNYFDYNYPQPLTDVPFEIYTEFAPCPWNDDNDLLMIGIQGMDISFEEAPANNLVFLIDVSGSMSYEDKLPMIKESIKILVENMREEDTVSIVTYSSSAEIKLNPTNGLNKEEIIAVVDSLTTSGGTNGSNGIELAYDLAYSTFNFNGNNRVILATDGDFNIGTTNQSELVDLVTEKAEIGIYLTVLAYGGSVYAADMMEKISNGGQGNYYYIDTLQEANKVLNYDIASTIVPIADDVKVQIEFNTDVVESYRLIGYENRVLDNDDFDDDEVDAGDLGAGHNVTAFYEITLLDDITIGEDIVATINLRYKDVGEDESQLIQGLVRLTDYDLTPSSNFLFASAVVEVSLVMRDSDYVGNGSYENAIARIEANIGEDFFGFRYEFLTLVQNLNNFDD